MPSSRLHETQHLHGRVLSIGYFQSRNGRRPAVQENNSIIEIGAVLVDPYLDIVDRFSSLCRPDEPITPYIEKLTGIKDAEVQEAPGFGEVAERMEAWVLKAAKPRKVRLAAWGNYFDMPLLRHAYRKVSRPFPWHGTCLDIKTLAWFWACLSGRNAQKLSVSTVADLMGIQPGGTYHRALVDAEVQARIMIEIQRKLSGGLYLPNLDGKPYRYLRVKG
jgi:inhibitor of KinA sporulation pathway (predicted exonuclease)